MSKTTTFTREQQGLILEAFLEQYRWKDSDNTHSNLCNLHLKKPPYNDEMFTEMLTSDLVEAIEGCSWDTHNLPTIEEMYFNSCKPDDVDFPGFEEFNEWYNKYTNCSKDSDYAKLEKATGKKLHKEFGYIAEGILTIGESLCDWVFEKAPEPARIRAKVFEMNKFKNWYLDMVRGEGKEIEDVINLPEAIKYLESLED